MTYPTTSFIQAMTSPDTHLFMPGIGYVNMLTAPPLAAGARGKCNPPSNVVDMSWHTLKPAAGPDKTFQWVARNQAWLRVEIGALRIAFSPDYLSSHGWSYMGPAVNRHG